MNALKWETAVEELLRDLEIVDPAETSVGTWNGPEGEMRVAIIHETGHVYAVPGKDEEGGGPTPFPAPSGEDGSGGGDPGGGGTPGTGSPLEHARV